MYRNFCKDCRWMRKTLLGKMICTCDDNANYNPLTGKKKYISCKKARLDIPNCSYHQRSFTNFH